MACFYNQEKHCTEKMTREHIVSASVLKVAFGDPIRNISRADMFGSKYLVDHEAVVKDVCDKCNNVSLSPYDGAGKKLAKHLEDNKNITPLKIPFDNEILGWILKTHFNYTRVIKDVETNEAYPIKQSIKNNLIKSRAVSSDQIALYVQQWEEGDQFWDAENPENMHYLQYRSIRLRNQEMVMSNFRIRQFDTMIFFPSNGEVLIYKNSIPKNVNSIIIGDFVLQKQWYGGTNETGNSAIREAAKKGANGILIEKQGHRVTGWSWASPYTEGKLLWIENHDIILLGDNEVKENKTIEERLKRLELLFESQKITKEEFSKQRVKILNEL